MKHGKVKSDLKFGMYWCFLTFRWRRKRMTWDRFISPGSVRFQFFLLGNRLNSQTNWKPNWKQTEYCRFISRIVRFGLSVRFAHSVCFKNAKRTENFSSFGVFETNWTCKTNWKWTELCRFIKEQKMNWERQTDWKRTEPGLMNLSLRDPSTTNLPLVLINS